ncbi:MAG: AmmeMemoRadiSam system protein A [Lachnospiraceae bacterium]|nr:AmmeMemoRadiSam system protein A [Lachnospiraceae bacterium]
MSILAAFMVPHPPMIVPAIGRGSEKQVETTVQAYEQVAREIAALKPDTIVITSPHALMYADYFHISPGKSARGSFSDFGAGQVCFDVEYDAELVELITRLAQAQDFPAGTLGERQKELDHGTMVPLWFIQREYTDFKLVRIGLSGLPLTDHYTLGKMVAEAANRLERRIVFVASGDLSHKLQNYGPYGFAPEGPVYDERIMDVCSRGAFGELFDFDETFCEKAAECGHRSFVIMAGALDGLAVKAAQLSHEDVTGVGYGIYTFYPAGEDDSRHFLAQHLQKVRNSLRDKRDASDPYVRLARETVEQYVLEHRKPRVKDMTDLPPEMLHQQAGAFVSIHEHGRLRGCIGTIAPVTESLAQEIIDNAVSAATRDPRFNPITPDELEWLEISVDVLGEPEEISSRDELDVKRYGVIVTSGSRRGLLLPDLDGVDTVDQQVDIAMRKGGISPRDKYRLERFEVIRHE